MERINKILKWPVLFLWDKYEIDPALALGLFVLLGFVFAWVSIWITVVIWGYVVGAIIAAIVFR